MNRYFTLMIVPERDKGVKSFRIPRLIFHAFLFLLVVVSLIISILIYDYWKILKQVYENKHLTIENRQLKEQIQLFQMKINGLTDDLERIQTFEKKLRIITGIEKVDLSKNLKKTEEFPNTDIKENDGEIIELKPQSKVEPSLEDKLFDNLDHLKRFEDQKEFVNLKNLYEKKIATSFGLQTGYAYTKDWSSLNKQSFELAGKYAEFDYKYDQIKTFVNRLEKNVHELDQYLLDKDSFLRSTPTLLPTKGWITSYYGPRISPTSKRLRMHEGIDIGARSGTPIVASADGKISFSGVKPGFGMFVQIDHGYGIESFYAHAKSLFVKRGQTVKRGDLIAAIGNTGASTGPHLHYEIRVNGTPVDPLYFVLD
ncbi:MAG: peptidoglycan DD-metalloendopeptidase family protein [Oligoflexia bacterium]|nr:peptidoglycan DD-metalloendopeptidase family protein [Oligoflexia bacterium]